MTDSLFNLAGKVAAVSGAAGSMGRAMSLALAEAGADVVLIDLNEEGARDAAKEIEELGQNCLVAQCDVSNPDDIRTMFASIDEVFGQIDFLGNVAGDAVREKPETIRLEDIEYSWRNLVLGRFCCCQEAGRRMLAKGSGSIVNIGSLASVTALGRGHIGYSMAMGAVAQMTRELSTEWAHRGVRVNAILPAQVMNDGLQKRIDADPEIRDRFLSGIPSGRFGHPDDIRGLSVFLASDASSWITGALIPMDGGNLAQNAGGSHGSETFNE
ncbi:MAG: SDR family oxidoreductase [Verrucomicrobiota bacterium]|jgi:NAD(P)-dependent dehydrogenase (short-subunit alcohol dehydrogenase family)|nr:SDR family oxidoreductase [Verrucomicrobiota bacterium]MDP7048598.1 SDR family oxidoreductase [Verrucomicrobiota bacterium]